MNNLKYMGMNAYTDDEVPGAYRNGSRVEKIQGEEEDRNPIGAIGLVLGSMGIAELNMVGYFVEWDTDPGKPVFVSDWKIKLL
jgi:hypothetical protein